jgi:hypothetical protein
MTWKRFGPHIVAQNIENEVVIADLRTGVYHNVTGSGALMWEAIDGGLSRQQIMPVLREAYEETPEILNRALTEFVDQLVADDLIKATEATAAVTDPPTTREGTEKRPFVPPAVSRFLSTDETFAKRAKFVAWQPSAPHVVSKVVGNEILVAHARKGSSCILTGCGALIWTELDSGRSTDQITLSVLSQYDISEAAAKLEIDAFMAELASNDLIQPKDAALVNADEKPCAPSDGRKPFTKPAITIDNNREETLRQITKLNGWQVSTPQIVSETIDDEVIAVDLQAGVYHSITGAGAVIWEGLLREQPGEQILTLLLTHYDVSLDTAEQELNTLIGRLAEFNLIRPLRTKTQRTDFTPIVPPTTKQPFTPAAMVIYTDMESVLRLDPIHDFDEYGWPSTV